MLESNIFLLLNYFDMRLFLLTIPKPLKQYTHFKKDYPFRSYICFTCVHGVYLSTSFSWLEREIRRRGAFSPNRDSNAFVLTHRFDILGI